MSYKSIIVPTTAKIAVSHSHALGVDDYDLREQYSPDTAFWKSKVLDLGSPKRSPNNTYIFDRSRYRNHGTITGATWERLPSGLWVLTFASGNYIQIASETVMNFTSGAFSAFVWVKPTTIAGDSRFLFIRGAYTADGWALNYNTDGKLWFETYQASAVQSTSTNNSIITTTGWQFIGITRSGATGKIWRDAVNVTASSGTHINPVTCSRTMKLGIYDDLVQDPFIGSMGLWLVANVALSQAQITQLYNQTRHLLGV